MLFGVLYTCTYSLENYATKSYTCDMHIYVLVVNNFKFIYLRFSHPPFLKMAVLPLYGAGACVAFHGGRFGLPNGMNESLMFKWSMRRGSPLTQNHHNINPASDAPLSFITIMMALMIMIIIKQTCRPVFSDTRLVRRITQRG